MNETRLRRTLPDQSSGSGYTIDTSHHSVTNTILSKRVCFYKSGDPQFNGLRVVINNRTFKTFDALLDSLSKKVPLPFGVRNITTPRGVHGINTLDELEDGKSYICSDNRKVKPIDLALARRKLPPWYHARSASSRRRTAKFFPGWKNIHREDPVVFRTPKKLVVFRNGNPSVRYTVLLHKKTTPSYESILGHISELMQFHVSKLHTPNGQRIDGLPGLILCSGSVVAVGREPFRPVEYSAEKPPSSTRRHTEQRAFKRQKTSVSKKMTPLFSSKSRNFSASSERYIVHQIHNSIAESSCDLPSNVTNSIESDSDRILESLTETEEDTCLGKGVDEGQDGALSNDDNIEKSFRVNQDGSMTVEMKVRLTIKEEETVQWTTTLTRSVVADQLNVPCLLDSDPDQEVCLKNSQTSAASTDIIHKDRTRDENDDDPPSLGNGAFIDSCQEVDDLKDHAEGGPPRRAPTPGCKTRSKLQSSVDSFEDVTVDKYEEGKVGSYFFGEETKNRTTEQFYLDQKGTRPVPKPRQLGSVDANSRDFSAFKSTEIMQTESSREEVTETVLHIYEQQTCHDNFLANVGVHSMPASGATSETRQLCSSNEFDHWRPSLAFEPVSKWRTDSRSVTSELHLASLKAGAKREQLQQSTKRYVKPGEKEVKKDQSVSSRPRKHVRLVMTAGKRRKKGSVKAIEKRKRVKPFSSAVFIKRIYGNKAKPPNKMKKIKKRATATLNSLPKPNAKNANVQLSLKEKMSKPILSKTEAETSHPQRELTWQSKNESSHLSKDRPSQPFNPSSSVAKEYVENWLENAQSNPSSTQNKESKIAEGLTLTQTQTNVGHFSEETPKTSKTFEITSSENVITPSVKLRVQSFEHKSTAAVEKTRARPKSAKNYATTAKVENYHSLSQKDTQATHFLNGFCSEILPPRTETNEGNRDRNMTTPTRTVSMDLPPPPPELLIAEDFSASVTSSPMSSQRSDNYPVSMSPTSDKAISPDDNKMEKSTSAQNQNPLGELSRAPSIKKAPLVSNWSLESKMSLGNTTLDKYASDYDATEEETPLSAHIGTVGDEICLRRTTQQVKATSEETQQPVLELGTPSFCTSVSPLSLTSDERMSPSSVVSSETSFLGDIPIQETKMVKTPLIEKQSPKNLMKRAKLKSSPSPERKFHSKKSSELQNTSPKLSAMTGRLLDEHVISNKGLQRPETPNATPSTERKHHETKELQRTSPYSQSLDVVSPLSRHKSKKLPRNLSLDSPSESKNRKPKKTSSQRESHLTAQIEADNSEEAKATEVISVMPESINAANQPNMKPVLEKICYSIKSIKQITQNKRPSCLEKSNSLPDFSSHVSSTFGSSSKVLLAFLAVMTLKDGLTNLNMKELNANNVSCSEALKMIDSLREIANIEDSQRLRNSLSDLQQSASIQLLQSWRGFQELGDRCKSHSATPNDSEAGLGTGAGPEPDCGIGENVIDEIIDNLEIPQKLKEELVSLSEDAEGGNNIGGNMQYSRLKLLANQNYHENTKNVHTEDCVAQDDKPNVDARKDFRFNVDDDSGNDNSSFEEHVDEVQLKDEVKQISSLIEEELRSYEKDPSSEKEQVCKERKMKIGHAQNHETPPRVQLEDSNLETIERQSDVITQSVAERVTLLEQHVAEAQRPKLAPKSSPIRRFSQRKSPPELVDSPSELLLCTRSAPQSSLSFSYDSSGVITTEPEGSSVRSIREMFLARSATDIQQRGLSSSNSSELRAETSGSGGYQSQTSSDLSSSEDVLAQKSISKGLVKRAIEMLYGKKDLKPEEASKRSPSEPDQRKREPTSIFSPFHAAGSKAMSELSYFNSSNALDIFSEATRCVAFNAQVGPGDSVPIDNGRWLLREKTSMRKSVSDPIGINKTFTNTFHDDGLCKDTEEKTPYSLFSTKPEVEDETKSQPGKCTYFSLPYASESEVCQDEMAAVSMSSKNEDDVLDSAEETKDSSEDSKTWAERNGILPGIGAADFKMKGNKVHPLVELPPDLEVVVVQPGKGQGVVSRRIQEPDVLDLLYNFCGEHCPIL
ncbi:hypothetical protein CHARACLAT_007859 [Characodon lateralis]|uniref:Doublecortin domain-containing protein n=1 Tax=Characodon lateralis TaxID=208331 RepID=A0ABU7DYM3_9TELE|nr:hypothetical protein [Characodon lateralis]